MVSLEPIVACDVVGAYDVMVDYDLSLEEAMRVGKYDFVSYDITPERFPAIRSGRSEVKILIVRFVKGMNLDDARAEIEKRGLQVANLREILALWETHQAELKEGDPYIIALGSAYYDFEGRGWPDADGNNRTYVPYISRVPGCCYKHKEYKLGIYSGPWSSSCQFAAVSK